MEAITDVDLPVRIQAAITLPELARYEDSAADFVFAPDGSLIDFTSTVRAKMVPNIGRIMQGTTVLPVLHAKKLTKHPRQSC